MSRIFRRRRRGAGMTEYVILVGLIGILLFGAVERYKTQIEVTIVGSDGQGGMSGDMSSKVTDPMTKLPPPKKVKPGP